jgi:hypothetical protein
MKILFGVDARKLGGTKDLKSKRFSKVVFNFPHTGSLSLGPFTLTRILTQIRQGNNGSRS